MQIIARMDSNGYIVYAESTLHDTLGYGDPDAPWEHMIFCNPKRDNRALRMRKQGDDDLAKSYEFLMALAREAKKAESGQWVQGIQQILDLWKARRLKRKNA